MLVKSGHNKDTRLKCVLVNFLKNLKLSHGGPKPHSSVKG